MVFGETEAETGSVQAEAQTSGARPVPLQLQETGGGPGVDTGRCGCGVFPVDHFCGPSKIETERDREMKVVGTIGVTAVAGQGKDVAHLVSHCHPSSAVLSFTSGLPKAID